MVCGWTQSDVTATSTKLPYKAANLPNKDTKKILWSVRFLQAKNENWSGHHFLLYFCKFRNLTKPGRPHIRQHGSAKFNFTGGK